MDEDKYKNIAIIKLSSLGDIVHTLPALNILRKRFPHSRISWIVESTGAGLLENFYGIDDLIIFNIKVRGIKNKIREIKKLTSQYRRKFDLILDFQGLLKSAVLAYLLKGFSVGFNKKNLREPFARFFYKKRCGYFHEKDHVILKNIHLLHSVSSEISPAVNYPLKEISISKNLNDFLETNKLSNRNFLVMNVGGGWETKRLSTDQFISLIESIKRKYKIVLLWGNKKEKKNAEEISRSTGTIISKFFNFSDLITLIKLSSLIVTGDTLALHLADVTGTPSVGIFGPSSPFRNGSMLKESIPVYEEIDCSFCYKKKCDKIDCLRKISIEKIVESIELINEKRS